MKLKDKYKRLKTGYSKPTPKKQRKIWVYVKYMLDISIFVLAFSPEPWVISLVLVLRKISKILLNLRS